MARRRTDHELRGAYRVLRAQFLRRCAVNRVECYFGDGPIDYTLSHGHPEAPTVHHTVAVGARPDLEMETSLWAPAHSVCNKVGMAAYDVDGLGTDGVPDTGIPSEDWDAV